MQKISYSETLNAVHTEIGDVFYSADWKLGWPFKSFGIGFNMNIISQCKERQADLIVSIKSGVLKGNWKISNQELFNCIDCYNTEYIVKSHFILKVIPAKFFSFYDGVIP